MANFSERYGYVKPSDVLIRELIPIDIQNTICTCYDRLKEALCRASYYHNYYMDMEQYLWTDFLNKRLSVFGDSRGYNIVATKYIEDRNNSWNRKLDIIESSLRYLSQLPISVDFLGVNCSASSFLSKQLNREYERLNFAYRVISDNIVEITSNQEISSIEEALKDVNKNISIHFENALQLYSKRPEGDYRNSIKDSISAVEAYCREQTGESTLGKALDKLESKGIIIPAVLHDAFEKLYAYTNQKDTGIRHALMDSDSKYVPSKNEALFMLVSCSAFVNYLRRMAIK